MGTAARRDRDQRELLPPFDLNPMSDHQRPSRWQRTPRKARRLDGVPRLFLTCWTAFHIRDIPVRFHYTCLFYPVGCLLWWNRDAGGVQNLFEIAVILTVFWGSLLAHEWAHITMARRLGVGARAITVLPIGAAAHLESMPRGSGEFWIALAGPVCSFLVATVFWALHWIIWMPLPDWSQGLTWALHSGFVINVMLAGFNLLPCYPMDGGRMLRAGLALMLAKDHPRQADRAHRAASRITVRCVVPVMVLGAIVVTVFHTHQWMHLLLFPLLWLAAELEYRMTSA
jgi:Zn-dependent protease